MSKIAILFAFSCAARLASASPVIFTATVSTGSLNGTSGYLDFSFAPGVDSQSASVTVSAFSSGGALTAPAALSGAVSGDLPGDVVFQNTTAFNDYFQAFDFDASLSFLLLFDGLAVFTPNGTSTSGSTFSFAMFAADQTTPLLTDDPSGSAFTVDLGLTGALSVTTFPNGGGPAVSSVEQVVPEPASALLMACGLAVLAFRARQFAI